MGINVSLVDLCLRRQQEVISLYITTEALIKQKEVDLAAILEDTKKNLGLSSFEEVVAAKEAIEHSMAEKVAVVAKEAPYMLDPEYVIK